jgi:replication-associated recombination protein RarA
MIDLKDKFNHLRFGRQNLIKDRYSNLTTQDQAIQFFSNIYGLDGMKENVFRALISEEQINILLVGPPATSKTLVMSTIQEKCNDVFYYDASNTTSAGLIEELFYNRNAKLIIIDEIDKLKRNDLSSLLSLLNNGKIVKKLKEIRYDFKIENVKIFATSNSIVNLSKPVRSRFQEYYLREYGDDDFIKVVKFCLIKKLPEEICEAIGLMLISIERKDVRAAIGISNLLKTNDTKEDVLRVFENWTNHKMEGYGNYN